MKARGIAIIDLEIEGGFREAAKEEEAIHQLIKEYVKTNTRVVHNTPYGGTEQRRQCHVDSNTKV